MDTRSLTFLSVILVLLSLSCFKTSLILIIVYLLHYWFYLHVPKLNNCRFRVCIVGAGFSGIGMALKLKKMGIRYKVFEATESVGGTWHYNIYPGCSCDIPSHLYSFSFEPNPYWTREYPGQKELWQYLKNIVHKNELDVKVNCRVEAARWSDKKQTYDVEFSDGSTDQFEFVVYAGGALRDPVIPEFPGQNLFRCPAFHSSNWDPNLDLTGKTVAVIGTGASAVQIIPEIKNVANKVLVFQRTACWCPPKNDRSTSKVTQALLCYVPGLMFLKRQCLFLLFELRYFLIFRKNGLFRNFIQKLIKRHIRQTVKNEELARKLTPNFMMGCKRITPSDEYLESFNCENVNLITDHISRFTEMELKQRMGIFTKLT